jgi:hypothetical protein
MEISYFSMHFKNIPSVPYVSLRKAPPAYRKDLFIVTLLT